jgi:hypothetical protein
LVDAQNVPIVAAATRSIAGVTWSGSGETGGGRRRFLAGGRLGLATVGESAAGGRVAERRRRPPDDREALADELLGLLGAGITWSRQQGADVPVLGLLDLVLRRSDPNGFAAVKMTAL